MAMVYVIMYLLKLLDHFHEDIYEAVHVRGVILQRGAQLMRNKGSFLLHRRYVHL